MEDCDCLVGARGEAGERERDECCCLRDVDVEEDFFSFWLLLLVVKSRFESDLDRDRDLDREGEREKDLEDPFACFFFCENGLPDFVGGDADREGDREYDRDDLFFLCLVLLLRLFFSWEGEGDLE